MKKSFLLLVGLCAALFSWGNTIKEQVSKLLQQQILQEAEWALQQKPITVTASVCSRSAGDKHDFYSEGDYWWPDSTHPDGPYIQKDGLTNPHNFTSHRHAMIRFSRIIGALASAWRITGNEKYVLQAQLHLKAWFADTATFMHPHLLYAQAIKGRFTGRGIGIIDTIHLMEVIQGILAMEDAGVFNRQLLSAVKNWFAAYLLWLTTHPYGKDEMNAKNNHGTCWVMQVACFARFTGDTALISFCKSRFKTVLLPGQLAADGSFPLELARTKPYGYSLFNLDAMATVCNLLSAPGDNLWTFTLPDGRNMQKAAAFMYPYVKDKTQWPYKQDVMYWNEWPVAQPFLLFGAQAFQNNNWFTLWKGLPHQPENEEVIRNLPVRHPLLWL